MTTEVTTTEASGNTTTSAFRGRAFQLTLNQVDKYEGLKKEFMNLKTCDYFLAAKERAPTTGHEHVHIYVHFSQPYKLNKKIMSYGAHIEVCRGSPKQNINYVKKDGDVIDEQGEVPHQGYAHTVAEMREMSVDDVEPHLLRIKKEIDREQRDKDVFFEMLREIQNDDLKAPEVIYRIGDTGKGKTYGGYKLALSKFKVEEIGKLTFHHGFCDVINENALCYCIEEFRPSQMTATDFLQLTDKYGYRVNTKGGFVTLRPKCLIISSIIPPEQLYENEEVNRQFMRRITKIINMDNTDDTV